MPKQPDTGVRVCGEATVDVVSSVIVAVVDGGSGVDVVPGFSVCLVVVTLAVPGPNLPVCLVVVTLAVPGPNLPVCLVVVTLAVPGPNFPVCLVVVTLAVPGPNFPVGFLVRVGVESTSVEGDSVGVGEADVVEPSAVGVRLGEADGESVAGSVAVGVGEADGESVAGSVAVAGAGSVAGPGPPGAPGAPGAPTGTGTGTGPIPGAVSEVVGVAEAEPAAVVDGESVAAVNVTVPKTCRSKIGGRTCLAGKSYDISEVSKVLLILVTVCSPRKKNQPNISQRPAQRSARRSARDETLDLDQK